MVMICTCHSSLQGVASSHLLRSWRTVVRQLDHCTVNREDWESVSIECFAMLIFDHM